MPRAIAGLLALAVIAVGCGSSDASSAPASVAQTAGPTATQSPVSTPMATPEPTPSPSASASPMPATPPPTPTASPSPTPSPTVAASRFPKDSVIVTFKVEDEQYRILLTTQPEIDIAYQLLAGEEAPAIPNGLVLPGDGGVNAPWTWHIDPESVEFADVTTEVCDGLPSYVEAGSLTSDRFCPWGAEVIDVRPANS